MNLRLFDLRNRIGKPGSCFGLHSEDGPLASIDYCHYGAPKLWFIVGSDEHQKLIDELKTRYALLSINKELWSLNNVAYINLTTRRARIFIVTKPFSWRWTSWKRVQWPFIRLNEFLVAVDISIECQSLSAEAASRRIRCHVSWLFSSRLAHSMIRIDLSFSISVWHRIEQRQ